MDDHASPPRTESSGLAFLGLRLIRPDAEAVDGELVDVSFEGAGATFGAEDFPVLPPGEHVQLLFTSKRTGEAVRITAEVHHSREQGPLRRYGFRFTNAADLRERLDDEMLSLFNRRRFLRVRPHASEPVSVGLLTEDSRSGEVFRTESRLLNISELGMALAVSPSSDARSPENGPATVEFELPGDDTSLHLDCAILYRGGDWPELRLGLEFIEGEALEAARPQIRDYVLRRRRAMVQDLGSDAA